MMTSLARVEIRYEQDVVHARQRARLIAEQLGFGRQDQTRISTCVSEIARNAHQYGQGGEVEFMLEATAHPPRLTIAVRDHGPGIADLDTILEGRYTSRTGLGRGIVGSRRLLEYFHIDTRLGQGTTVTLGKSLPLKVPTVTPVVLRRIADALAANCSASPMEEIRAQNQELVVEITERNRVSALLLDQSKLLHQEVVERRTAQQELEALNDKNAALLTGQQAILHSDVVSLIITQNRFILWATPSLLIALGYDWLEFKGRESRFIFQSEEAFLAWGEAAYPVILAHQVFRSPVQFRHKNGSLIWFDLAGTMFDENSDQVLWSCVDISAQKIAEAKLQEARQEAQSATVAKSQFLATMSHELRTPMNGILGMAQLLVLHQLQEDKRVQYAQTILNSGHTLLSLLNDILDLSKVEAGKLNLESTVFTVLPVVLDTRALFAETANAKGLQLESTWQGPAGQCYLGDPHRLRQMLSNLVSNAIKFTDHGFVRIVATEIERQSQHAVLLFSVSDSGIGITNEQQARLFQAFSQADSSTTRRFGGTGLGLSIVLQLAKLMGGEAGIDSQPGQGARFWFRVRVALQAGAQESLQTSAASVAVPARDLTGTVLIAEDNLVNRMVIMAMLGELDASGLSVTVVEDGQQALDFITQGGMPDLVLMDVQMPVMDGLEATEKIRLWQADHGKPRLPIVALTANAYEDDRQKCLAVGMDDFLVKPLDMKKLHATLTRWFVTV
jgi:signal transduction histidine kinase